MFVESDEGLGPSPIEKSYIREYPTFEPEEDDLTTLYDNHNSISEKIIIPQRLDLSNFNDAKSRVKKKYTKKLSPIKANQDTSVYPGTSFNFNNHDKHVKSSKNLNLLEKEFDAALQTIYSRQSSFTSDRASSISSKSSNSSDQRSLAIEIGRTKNLVKQLNQQAKSRCKEAFDDSGFNISRMSNSSKSYSSCHHEVVRDNQTEYNHYSNLDDFDWNYKKKNVRDVSTDMDFRYTDDQLYEFNAKARTPEDDRTLVEISNENGGSIEKAFGQFNISIGEVIPPTYRSEETPILTNISRRTSSSGSCKEIEVARNSRSDHVIRNGNEMHHSLSAVVVPMKLLEFEKGRNHNVSLPDLQRFVIRPSTRDIFNTPLDIDAICGKGVRKNRKSTEKIFGGAAVTENIHGTLKDVKHLKTPNIEHVMTGTVASNAKRKNTLKSADSKHLPFCSATQGLEGVSYSIAAVSQQLLGTMKSLYPDWLPLAHKTLNERSDSDVAIMFRDGLYRQKIVIEERFRLNRRNGNVSKEEFDEHSTNIVKIDRIIEKIDSLVSRRSHLSRIQQLKAIHTALVSS